jgi:hypothetical protein
VHLRSRLERLVDPLSREPCRHGDLHGHGGGSDSAAPRRDRRCALKRAGFLTGLAFGLILVAARVNEYDVIHDMLLLREPDVFLLMGSAVATAAPLLWLLRRSAWRTPYGGPIAMVRHPVTRESILGSIVFGAGWAVTGSCPGPVLAMAGGGGLLALPIMLGLWIGQALHDRRIASPGTGERDATAPGGATARPC